MSYPLHRAAVAVMSFGAAIIGARVLPTEQFSALMTAAFLAKFMQILNLGATAGYFVSCYSGDGWLQDDAPGAERHFLLGFLIQMAGFGLLVLGVAALWLTEYRTGAAAFLLLVPLFVLEPLLRYRRNFSFSLAPEATLTLALITAMLAHLSGITTSALAQIYLWAVALCVLIAISVPLWRLAWIWRARAGTPFTTGDYGQVLLSGGPVYVGTALFLVASSMDRLLLPLYGTDEQISVYFLAQQLSVGAMIFVTAINFVNTVNLGEARKEAKSVDRALVVDKLRRAALVAGASYSALMAGTVLLETVFLPESFDGLSWIVLLLGAGMAFFYTAGAITPIVAYFRRQIPLTVSMGAVALALAANNAWVYLSGHGEVLLAAGTALALTAHATFAVVFTFSVLRRQDQEGIGHAN